MAKTVRYDSNMIYTGASVAWVYKITSETISDKWFFDNIKSGGYKGLKPSSDSGSSEYTEISRADAGTVRFAKRTLIVNGETGADDTPASASSDATSLGEITLETNQSPLTASDGSASLGWTAFVEDVRAELAAGTYFLVILPTGFTYSGLNGGTKKVDGFAYMIGKLDSDIEQTLDGNPSSLSLTFVSYKGSGLIDSADLTGLSMDAIVMPTGSTGTAGAETVTGISITPVAITTKADDILAGKIAFVPNS